MDQPPRRHATRSESVADSPAILPFPGSAAAEERRTELLLDALKTAIAHPGEHRLFRSGKLAGLLPNRATPSAEAALAALQEGLLETSRTETRGKQVIEWVRVTPKGVAFVHDRDSPKAVLRELRTVLDATRTGVPMWMEEARQELAELSARFDTRAEAVLKRLEGLAKRVESALRRAELNPPGSGGTTDRLVPWAGDALDYLDRRVESGGGDCPLPELFDAVRARCPDLDLTRFQDGIRRLHDLRAVRLRRAGDRELEAPEYAIVVDGEVMDRVGR